jgi:hypothetical protein
VDDDGLGGKFWFGLIGIIIAGGIAAFLIFALVGRAWYRWGALGGLLFFCALLLLFAYIHDRRSVRSYEE